MNWSVYIIRCSDRSFYTGITTNIDRRCREHARGTGARFFWGRKPLEVVYLESRHSRSSAASREYEIKAMARAEKCRLMASTKNELQSGLLL